MVTVGVMSASSAQPPRYEPYLDTPIGTFRWRLGLRPLDLDDWLQFDEHAAFELAYKQQLTDRFPDTVFQVLNDPQVEHASVEVRDAIELAVGRQADRSLHPLDAAGRIAQEDLVLLVERDGELICAGGSVCFPNRWDLASKVGRTMREIHVPVAQLNEQLGDAIDRTLARLTPERSFWRLGWTVLDTDDLYQAVDGTATSVAPVSNPADFWLRVERETLRRFPTTGAVLFTIRTYLTPIRDIPVNSTEHLAAALEAMDDDIVDYKSLQSIGPQVSTWLRSHPPQPTPHL